MTASNAPSQPSPHLQNQRGTAWQKLPRRQACRSPLLPILGEDAPGPFTLEQITQLRAHVATAIPPLPHPGLELFLGSLMDSPATVSAYFRPTRVFVPQYGRPLVQWVLPFDFALEAARKAAAMPSLLPQERALAWLAAFAYPVGHFFAADTSRGAAAFTDVPQEQRLQDIRALFVEDGIRALRRKHPVLAETLKAALGFGPSEACDSQQVARLVSAVRLATLRIEQMWKEVGEA